MLFINVFMGREDGRLWQTPQDGRRDCRQRHKAGEEKRAPAHSRNADLAPPLARAQAAVRQLEKACYGVAGAVAVRSVQASR